MKTSPFESLGPMQKLSRTILLLPALFISLISFAQNPDAYKKFINKTSIAVMKAQKEMIAASTNNVDGKLAQLFILQMNAVALYNQQNYKRAVFFSSSARLAAKEIIKGLHDQTDFYDVSADEKKLLTLNISPAEVDAELQKNFPSLSRSDRDYLTPQTIDPSRLEIQE